MIKINRIISIVLSVFIFSMGNMGMATASESEDYAQDIAFLGKVGLIDPDTYASDEKASREEAAVIVMGLIGITEAADAYRGEFRDVDKDDLNAGMIKTAVLNNLLEFDELGRVHPQRPISYLEALTLIYNGLKYHDTARYKGYYTLAQQDKLLGGMKIIDQNGLSKGELARLVVNAAQLPLMVPVSYGDTIKYVSSKSVTALSKYHDIHKLMGIVTQNHFTGIYSKVAQPNGYIKIDDASMAVSDGLDVQGILGKEVTVFYKEGADHNSLIYLSESSRNDFVVLEADNIMGYSNRQYAYQVKNNQVTYTVQKDAAIIYNGVAITSDEHEALTNNLFKPESGKVELISTKRDGRYDIVKIKSYQTYVAQSVDRTDNRIMFKYGAATLNLSERKVFEIKDAQGSKLGIRNIDEWNVLSVAVSYDETTAEVIVSNEAVTGTLNEISTFDGEIRIEGETFKLSPVLADNIRQLPAVGENIVAYLDIYGKVAAAELATKEEWQYAYLMSVGLSKGLDAKLLLKVLNQEGGIEEFTVASNVYIDGELYKRPTNALSLLAQNQIIRYRVNRSGQISNIDTPIKGAKENEKSLTETFGGSDIIYKSSIRSFGGIAFPEKDALVFVVPTRADAENKDYVATGLNYFVNDVLYNVTTYSLGSSDLTEKVILCRDTANWKVHNKEIITVVDRIALSLDEDGNAIWKIYGINTSGAKEYFIDSRDMGVIERKGIQAGDILRIAATTKNQVVTIQKVFDKASNSIYADIGTINPTGAYNAVFRVSYGKALVRSEDLLIVELHGGNGLIEKYRMTDNVFVVTDNKISRGSVNDIICDPTGYASSNIVIDICYSVVRSIVVYK